MLHMKKTLLFCVISGMAGAMTALGLMYSSPASSPTVAQEIPRPAVESRPPEPAGLHLDRGPTPGCSGSLKS
jgi:hypothetical protein